MLIKFPPPPPLAVKHFEERLKFSAGGLQNLALLLFGAVLLQPALNASFAPAAWRKVAAVFISGMAERSAIALLRYVPVSPEPKGRE